MENYVKKFSARSTHPISSIEICTGSQQQSYHFHMTSATSTEERKRSILETVETMSLIDWRREKLTSTLPAISAPASSNTVTNSRRPCSQARWKKLHMFFERFRRFHLPVGYSHNLEPQEDLQLSELNRSTPQSSCVQQCSKHCHTEES
jgi:hypothetical protein